MEKLALLASIGVADVIGTAAAADDQGNAILKEVATLLFVFTGKKKLRSTNPETTKARLFISNCFELPSYWLPKWLISQLESSSKQLPDFEVPGFVLL